MSVRELRIGRREMAILRLLGELGGEATVTELAVRICGGGRKCYKATWKSAKTLERKGFVATQDGRVRLVAGLALPRA